MKNLLLIALVTALGLSSCTQKVQPQTTSPIGLFTITDGWGKPKAKPAEPAKSTVVLTPATGCPGKIFDVTLRCGMKKLLQNGGFKPGAYQRLLIDKRRLQGTADMFAREPEGCEEGRQIQICLARFMSDAHANQIRKAIDRLGYRPAKWWELANLGADNREILSTYSSSTLVALGSQWGKANGDAVLYMSTDYKRRRTLTFGALDGQRFHHKVHFPVVRKGKLGNAERKVAPGAAPRDETCPGPVYDISLECNLRKAVGKIRYNLASDRTQRARSAREPNTEEKFRWLRKTAEYHGLDHDFTSSPAGCEEGKRTWVCLLYFDDGMTTKGVYQKMDELGYRPAKWWELTSLAASKHNIWPGHDILLSYTFAFVAMGDVFGSTDSSRGHVMGLLYHMASLRRSLGFEENVGAKKPPPARVYWTNWNDRVIFPAIRK